MDPIDIITNEITAPVMAWTGNPATAASVTPANVRSLAQLAVSALTNDVIVANAVQALRNDNNARAYLHGLTEQAWVQIARTVLGSVGGA